MESDRAHYGGKLYPQLQGLRLLPLAALFALSACYRAGWFHLPGDDRPGVAGRWFSFGVLLAIWASYRIRAWYWLRYGKPRQRWRDSQLWPIAFGIVCLLLATSIQAKAKPPFSLPVAVLGLMLAGFGVAHYAYRRHYIAAGAVCLAVAFLRMFGLPASIASVLFDAAVSVAITIVAIGDHRLVVTTQPMLEPDAPATLREVEADV